MASSTKIVYYVGASVDGFIAQSDGDISWLKPFEPEDYGYEDFYRSVDRIIVGSKTYEQSLAYGSAFAKDKTTYVLTHRSLPRGWPKIVFHSGSPKELVEQLRREAAGIIWLLGGGSVAGSFLNAGLVDELIVTFVPVLLGSGIALFQGANRVVRLLSIDRRFFDDGVVQLHFRVDYKSME